MTQTMKSQLLKLLLKQWVTPYIALDKVGCMSLSQRCGEFQRERACWDASRFWSGYVPPASTRPPQIFSKWVSLPNGKRCKAYRAIK